MTHAIIVGPDRGLEAALGAHDVTTTRIETPASAADLDAAGIDDASLFFLTDGAEATLVPVAREHHPELRIVWYATQAVPEFVTRQLDLGVDPELADAAFLVEEQVQALES
ncbi:MAG: DUF7126 family protein [Halobacteriota archaeon]